MLIKHLAIENYGPFYGRNQFDLEPLKNAKQSVTIIGGDNGFGKTSFLNALRLCLYGRRASDLWGGPNQQAYRQYIAKLFNNKAFDESRREMSLEVCLLVWENKIRHEMTVRRTFHLTDNRLFINDGQESLLVLRDGKPLPIPANDNADGDLGNEYDTLLRILIPAHFSQFYFFDGEKVRSMFHRPKPEEVAKAVRDLLGLSLLERLCEDMVTYRRFKLPELYGKHSKKQGELKAKQADSDKIEAGIQQLEIENSEITEELDELNRKLVKKEKEFKRLGGMQREELELLRQQEQACDVEYDGLTRQLRASLGDQISSCFILPFKDSIENRIEAEKIRREWMLKRDAIEPHIASLQERLLGDDAPAPEPPLSPHQIEFLSERFAVEVRKLFWPPPRGAAAELWFDLREQEIVSLTQQLKEAAEFSAGSLKDLIESKNRVFSQRERIRERLAGLGDTGLTQPIAEEIQKGVEKRGELNAKLSEIRSQIEHAQRQLAELNGQLTSLASECEKSAVGQEREDYAKRVEAVVRRYLDQAGTKKTDEIERHLNKLFFAMVNCRNEIREISLNRETYELTIIDKKGNIRPLDTGLSEGQAQVLALAFVGALAKASGRILPFIIDTPLGRLDVNHRRDVTEKFFLGPAPQTILLSTPTEINNCVYDNVHLKLLDTLKPYIAHAYTLEREEDGVVRVEKGYFGNKV